MSSNCSRLKNEAIRMTWGGWHIYSGIAIEQPTFILQYKRPSTCSASCVFFLKKKRFPWRFDLAKQHHWCDADGGGGRSNNMLRCCWCCFCVMLNHHHQPQSQRRSKWVKKHQDDGQGGIRHVYWQNESLLFSCIRHLHSWARFFFLSLNLLVSSHIYKIT